MRLCKRCNEWKDESAYYLKGHRVNGVYYTNHSAICNDCKDAILFIKINKNCIEGMLKMFKAVKGSQYEVKGED